MPVWSRAVLLNIDLTVGEGEIRRDRRAERLGEEAHC